MEIIFRSGVRGKQRGVKEPLCVVLVFFRVLDDVEDMLSGVAHHGRGVVCNDFRL
jgi:hypothetical protein